MPTATGFRSLILLSFLALLVFCFQNCSPFREASSGQLASLATPSGRAPSSFPQLGELIEPTVFLPNAITEKALFWTLDFSDEFEGAAGAPPSLPWHFDLTYDGEEKLHRRFQYNNRDHAFLDGNGALRMEIVNNNGRIESSILRSCHFERGEQLAMPYPTNYFLDPTQGPMYIESSVRLDRAFQTDDTWWAFWLFAPATYNQNTGQYFDNFRNFTDEIPLLDPYDLNPDSGMEVDIFEYVPYLGNGFAESRNGFNMAVFTRDERNGLPAVGQHIPGGQPGVEPQGFVSDFAQLAQSLGGPPNIDLTDGNFHTIGLYWDLNKYEFFVDGIKVWEVTDPNFITRTRSNILVLSWEFENGLWGDSIERRFEDQDRDVFVLVDYVRVWRMQ